MSLCKQILKKDIYELELEDLKSFFSDPQEESSVLEFKSGGVTLEMVQKEVAAFLNTEGGLLILGAPKEKSNNNVKVCFGELTPCTNIFNQDTLLRSLASNISPSPVGIKAKSFELETGLIFVVDIQQSATPPHQVSNEGKYYIRLEREAKSAPHGIVEALFNRRQVPNLNGELTCTYNPEKHLLDIFFTLSNSSIITAERVGYIVEVSGVSSVRRLKNVNSQYKLNDDFFSVQSIMDNMLLVNGLSFSISLSLNVLKFSNLVSVEFYCKDSRLKSIHYLVNHKSGSIDKMLESDGLNVIKDDFQVLVKDCWSSRAKYIQDILNKWQPSLPLDPASVDLISALENHLGFLLPSSFVSFLEISNGFVGYFKSLGVEFYTIKQITEQIDEDHRATVKNFVIGYLDNQQIWLEIEQDDDGTERFTFHWNFIRKNDFRELTFDSFYGLLEMMEKLTR